MIQAFSEEPARWSAVRELAGIVAGSAAGRANSKEITIFKSIGIAAWDVTVAARVYERALDAKRGLQVPLWQQSG